GIISARGRDINAGPYDDFIQTDASINRGNSGGPMFNIKGEVIGINTAIYSPSGGSVGIGFAIPSSTAEPVIKQLIKYGEVQRGWLGVHIQVVTESIAETLGLKKTEGALVASVIEGGPAAKAGIKPRDVILEFDGKRVTEMRQLPRIVAATEVDRAVTVKVWRDGTLASLKVSIGKLDDSEETMQADAGTPTPDKEAAPVTIDGLGIGVSSATSAVRDLFGLADTTDGVVITEVDSDGSAFEEGVRPGDVLAEVSQEKVSTPQDVKRLVDAAKAAGKRSVLLLVEAQGGFRFVAVRLR
ncbi:MAG TPA: PDZ domain-containing protein, partial [Magnetovibrio sp.]